MFIQDICDSIVAGTARSRRSLKNTLNRLGRDSQSLVDDIITEFKLLSREISEGVLHGEDSFELRIARDMVSFFLFFFTEISITVTRLELLSREVSEGVLFYTGRILSSCVSREIW